MCIIKIVIKSVMIKILFKTLNFFILRHNRKFTYIHVFLIIYTLVIRRRVAKRLSSFDLIRALVTTVMTFIYMSAYNFERSVPPEQWQNV